MARTPNPIGLKIDADIDQALKGLNQLERVATATAVAKALNDARVSSVAGAVKVVSKEHGVKSWAVRERFFARTVRRARRDRHNTSFIVGTLRIPFGRNRETRSGNRSWVFTGLRQTQAGVISRGPHSAPGAFIATMPNDTTSVYRRTSGLRFPIEKVVIDLKLSDATQDAIDTKGGDAWTKRFDYHWKREMKKVIG